MEVNLGDFDISPENTYILKYPNDLMDGIFIDLDDAYAFISRWTKDYKKAKKVVKGLGIQTFDMTEVAEINLTDPPHLWVVSSLGRIIVEGAEQIIIDNYQDPGNL